VSLPEIIVSKFCSLLIASFISFVNNYLWVTVPYVRITWVETGSRMLHLSSKEIDILRFIRRSRHKTTIKEISDALQLPAGEVETFVAGMVNLKLINTARGATAGDDSYYTNPERREEIYELLD